MVDYKIRAATAADGEAMMALMPRLSAFEIPESRTPEHLWLDDAELLREWIAGGADDCFVHVAEDDGGAILGLTLVRLRPELLSHEPSAHLEAIAVANEAEGKGIGKALLVAAEEDAQRRGARTMTMHVFVESALLRELDRRIQDAAGALLHAPH